MSKQEQLNNILNKFAQLTKVLIEASVIKESNTENNFKSTWEKTKILIEELCKQTDDIKQQFREYFPENTLDDDEIGDTERPTSTTVGVKLVDINKLVEPKTIIKSEFTPKGKKTVQFNTSVVIISSSDDEVDNKRITTRRLKQKTKGYVNKSKTINNSDSSSDSSSTPDFIQSTPIQKHLRLKQSPTQSNDPKLKQTPIVNLLRIPCENLKEYYEKQEENMEIDRLTNLKTLKKRVRNKNSDSEQEKNSKKSKLSLRKTQEIPLNDISSEENSPEISDGEDAARNSNDDFAELDLASLESENKSIENDETYVEKEPEKSGETLKDKENDKTDETIETIEESLKGADNSEIAAGDSNETNGKSDEIVKEKDQENNSKGETKKSENKEADAPKVNGEVKGSETEESDVEKKLSAKEKGEDKKKKVWRKDKLLTEKLTSDSEEGYEKFCKKKNKSSKEIMSDDEIQIPDKTKRKAKKRLKKAFISDSDSDEKKNDSDDDFDVNQERNSSSSDTEKEESKEEEKKKRKRVKRMEDSSDDDDDEKSTRKQIRNILGRDSLAETTKQAEDEEKERKQRLLDKQKKYNQIFEITPELNAKVDSVVLDFDEKSKKELLKVHSEIVEKLKPHQAKGVQFMWDACFESIERAQNTVGSGCILAHCMGLGKTLQVIALSHTLLMHSELTKVKKVMVVCPLNTVLNWVQEYQKWVPSDADDFNVYELVSYKQNYERQYQLKDWHNNGGVLIIGYNMFRTLSNPDNKRMNRKMRTVFQEALVDPGPDLVVCDEGHLLKNEKTHLSIAMNRLKTLRRIVLTGTPLQNNLKEYFCMVQFIKPNLLGTYKEYLNRFVNPITNGQYTDSTPHDIQIMRKRSHVLHKMLDGVVQRRDYSVLQPYLPPKYEYVLFLNLTETQIKLYKYYMENLAKRSQDGSNRTSFLFVDFQELQRICTHPRVLLDKSIENKIARDKKSDSEESEGSIKDFINDGDDDGDDLPSTSSSDDDVEKAPARKRMTRATAALAKENNTTEIDDDVEFLSETKKEWWQEFCDGSELNVISHSNKLHLLFEILKECEQMGDKVLVFSQSLYSLNVIEYFLGKIDEATQSGDTVCGFTGSWSLGLDYFRLDGSSSCDNRSIWCKSFNKPSNTRARLFLISTRAGGLGINLVAANRVIIFDVSWNPSHDIQSIYRVYRFGQTKPCYIYRFVTYGTMEMKIYERQVIKQSISKRVIDEQQIDRHYNQNDIQELYKFDPTPENRPTPLIPKDVLLAELLQKYDTKIFKYHEHQSLLENKEEECLNEEERKAAWDEFENEKKARNNLTGFAPMMNPQIIAAALNNIVKKDYPTWNDAQIQSIIPTLTQQLQVQLAEGNYSMYQRVYKEMKLIQAAQNQLMKEQLYQQQAMRFLQQQQMAAAAAGTRFPNTNSSLESFLNAGQMAGPSTSNLKNFNPDEVIELN